MKTCHRIGSFLSHFWKGWRKEGVKQVYGKPCARFLRAVDSVQKRIHAPLRHAAAFVLNPMIRATLSVFLLAALSMGLSAQIGIPGEASSLRVRPGSWVPFSRIIVPNIPNRHAPCKITKVQADVEIRKGVAQTTLDVLLENPNPSRVEAEILLPVPDGAVVRGFDFAGKAAESTAKLLPKEEVLKRYRDIVAKMQDPAIMEFVNCNLIRSAVFPVEPKGKQKVRIVYDQILPLVGNHFRYVLPRSESLDFKIPWNIRVTLHDLGEDAVVFSPSHSLRQSPRKAGKNGVPAPVVAEMESTAEPGAFLLSYTANRNQGMAFLYPDPAKGGGYFMIVGANDRGNAEHSSQTMQRELILVLDRSGSMRGPLLEQAKEAARQTISSLPDGTEFNLIVYNESVDFFSPRSVRKSRETMESVYAYIDRLTTSGGTNLHDALLGAIRSSKANAAEGRGTSGVTTDLLFLTDGLPTIGQTSERKIRNMVEGASNGKVRIFTFGVGSNVNAPLLDKLSSKTGARSTFVLPNESIEVKVGEITRKLKQISDDATELVFSGSLKLDGLMPNPVPFPGEQIVLIGMYRDVPPAPGKKDPREATLSLFGISEAPGDLIIRGKQFRHLILSQTLREADASVQNAFVPRIFAARKIALLSDGIRELGLDGIVRPDDPRVKELVDEIVRLSLEFGVLSEYTAYFAEEGSLNLQQPGVALLDNIREKSMRPAQAMLKERSGNFAVSASINMARQKKQVLSNRRNTRMDKDLNMREEQSSANIQQMDRQSFLRNTSSQWIQGSLVNSKRTDALQPRKTIRFGSPDYDRAVASLVKENRQNALALSGEILLELEGETVLIQNTLP